MFSSPVSPVKHKLGKISISKKKKKINLDLYVKGERNAYSRPWVMSSKDPEFEE